MQQSSACFSFRMLKLKLGFESRHIYHSSWHSLLKLSGDYGVQAQMCSRQDWLLKLCGIEIGHVETLLLHGNVLVGDS